MVNNVEWLENKVTQADLNLAMIKMRSQLYDNIGGFFGIGKLNLLASFALFDDNPSMINSIETNFRKVNPELIKKTAREYLRPTNRTILARHPIGRARTAARRSCTPG